MAAGGASLPHKEEDAVLPCRSLGRREPEQAPAFKIQIPVNKAWRPKHHFQHREILISPFPLPPP